MLYLKNLIWKMRLALLSEVPNNLRLLKELQWKSKNEILNFQQKQLRKLLLHSFRHVPYYREILVNSNVIDNSCNVNLEYFSRIPFLSKGIIRSCYDNLKSDDISTRKWQVNTSGGSTGEPVKLIQDKDSDGWKQTVKILYDLWSGYSIVDKKVKLWGSERDLFVGHERLQTRVGQWIRSEVCLNTFSMSPAQMLSYVERINKFKPVQILAYVESIYEIARFIKREKLKIHRPLAIMSTAGTLNSHMRSTIESVFRSPVFNRYGSREVGDIACECDHHKGLHITPCTHYVEIIRPDGTIIDAPGEVGEIVVTLLVNYAMPLIRYRIEDMGSWADEPCSCGRSWPLLKEVTGRVTDTFITNNGTKVHGEFFTHLFYFLDWVAKFQVIQEEYDSLRVLIVPHEMNSNVHEYYNQEIMDITGKIKVVMGNECNVKYEFLDCIAPSASGKFRYTISNVEKC